MPRPARPASRLGFNPLFSAAAVPFIHGSFSYPTLDGWLPDLFFRIYLKNVHRGKHGSDSGARDFVFVCGAGEGEGGARGRLG